MSVLDRRCWLRGMMWLPDAGLCLPRDRRSSFLINLIIIAYSHENFQGRVYYNQDID